MIYHLDLSVSLPYRLCLSLTNKISPKVPSKVVKDQSSDLSKNLSESSPRTPKNSPKNSPKVSSKSPRTLTSKKSVSSNKQRVGWAIIFPEEVSLLIDPTEELLQFAKKDKVVQINLDDLGDYPENSQIVHANLRVGSYLTNYYLLINGQLLFPGRIPQCYWYKLMKTLKAQFVCTSTGEIYNSVEIRLISLVG